MALAPYTTASAIFEEDDWVMMSRQGATIYNDGKRVNREGAADQRSPAR
jgi:hypothetical protein